MLILWQGPAAVAQAALVAAPSVHREAQAALVVAPSAQVGTEALAAHPITEDLIFTDRAYVWAVTPLEEAVSSVL